MPRTKPHAHLKRTFWVPAESGFFTADRTGLEAAIAACGHTDAQIRRRMGGGHDLLDKALAGVRLTQWEAQHVETGLFDHMAESYQSVSINCGQGPKV